MESRRAAEELAAAIMPSVALSTWLIVFARGRIDAAPVATLLLLATEFLRTLPEPFAAVLLALSRLPFLGREDGVVVICNFCWCRKSKSRRAKHLVHSGHSNGFSLV